MTEVVREAGEQDAHFRGLLRAMALTEPDEVPEITALSGGVSADIVLAQTRHGPVCVKQTLPALKVAQAWHVSPTRGEAEKQWIRLVAGFLPEAVPAILGEVPEAHAFAMRYLEPRHYGNWKTQLSEGVCELAMAERIGGILGLIHARTAGNSIVARRFAYDKNFADLRLRPYFESAAGRNPDVATVLRAISARTGATKQVLVHGDYSPKNILIGPQGPVILDAECAWYGDPAFDASFCITHLLLKCLWKPAHARAYLAAAQQFWDAYRHRFADKAPDTLEAHSSTLIPALLLARVDGKSPVEYLDPAEQAELRRFACHCLLHPALTVPVLFERWRKEFPA